MKTSTFSLFFTALVLPFFASCKSTIDEIANKKDLEKLLRTRNNVLILYKKSAKAVPSSLLKDLEAAAEQIRGTASIVQIDCSTSDGAKICKKEKVDVASYILRHYSKGEFHKVYDRPETVKALVNFLRDPSADVPWEDDPTAKDVRHIDDTHGLKSLLQNEKKPYLIMFYAPWCGHCQRMKPEYAKAATELKAEAVLAAMDVNRPQNANVKDAFNITGFPTLYYFKGSKFYFPYSGPRTKDAIVSWMRNPQPPPAADAASGLDTDAPHEEL